MDLAEGLCAGCAKPLGIRANWRMVDDRAYHNDCEAPEPSPESSSASESQSLSEFAERKARNVLHGRGQRTLEEDK